MVDSSSRRREGEGGGEEGGAGGFGMDGSEREGLGGEGSMEHGSGKNDLEWISLSKK